MGDDTDTRMHTAGLPKYTEKKGSTQDSLPLVYKGEGNKTGDFLKKICTDVLPLYMSMHCTYAWCPWYQMFVSHHEMLAIEP